MRDVRFTEWSYERQRVEGSAEIPDTVRGVDTTDGWRHQRLYEAMIPLVHSGVDASWLTVGDGRCASDADFLHRSGVTRVTASNLSDAPLREARARGIIHTSSTENVEHLSFGDERFDFVLCKETYHHLPRPPLGLYEMLRVARRAVILIEPIEPPSPRLLDRLRTGIKTVLRGAGEHLYEPSGNFIYRTSTRELEKMLTALDLPLLATRRLNTFYLGRSASGWEPLDRGVTVMGIWVQDALCRLSLMSHGVACLVCYKQPPAKTTQAALRDAGFSLSWLHRNPLR